MNQTSQSINSLLEVRVLAMRRLRQLLVLKSKVLVVDLTSDSVQKGQPFRITYLGGAQMLGSFVFLTFSIHFLPSLLFLVFQTAD